MSGSKDSVRPVVRVLIYIRPNESLSPEQWLEAAARVRYELCYEECPWAAYLHKYDNGRRGEYLHLVLSRVTFDGKIVSDRYRVLKVMRGLERYLGLGPVG